jgi:WD40 repeat protein
MTRAGFAPQSYVDFWDRFSATHGNAGNWVTDLLGHTKPEQKRLRELLKWISMMPAECARIRPSSTTEFETWQARVIASSSGSHVESLPGLIARQKLALPLRPDINNLRFSPDGKYVLAQDEGGIHVLSRDPFQVLFFIEAPDADKAQFSPDSKAVVFESPSLRVETWAVDSGKRTGLHDVILPMGCLQSAVSPDGRAVACLDEEFALHLLDVETGRQLALKKKFFDPGSAIFSSSTDLEKNSNPQLIRLTFSPDAHYFLAGSARTDFAYDLRANHPIKLPSRIKEVLHGEFTFVDGERLLGLNSSNPSKSPLLAFPSGRRLQHVALTYAVHLKPTAQGRYVAVGPLESGKRGFMDPWTGKLNGICKEDAGDIYDNTVVYEEIDGRILQVEVSSGKIIDRVQLSQSHLGDSRAIEVSPDFNWLAASTASRGAMWDISQNARVQYVRAFTEGWFGEDDRFYAEFPPSEKQERALVKLNQQGGTSPVYSFGELVASQEGPYVLVRTPSRGNPYQRKDWTYEVRDFRSGKVVWRRHFPKEPPTLAWTPDYKTVLLGWPVATAAAHDELKAHPELKRSAENDDILYELVDVRTEAVVSRLIVKTNRYSFRVKSAKIDGNWVAFEVSGDRVLVYSLRSGAERGHVFGNAAAISSTGGVYAVSVGDGEVNLYGVADSQLRESFRFPVSIAYKKFSADGKRLFVLTRDQTAYVLDISSASKQSSLAVKTTTQ